MDYTQIVLLLTPLVVWLATWLVKQVLSSLPGWVLVGLIVPLISIIVALISNAISIADNFWIQVAIGVLAVFINEVKKQLTKK